MTEMSTAMGRRGSRPAASVQVAVIEFLADLLARSEEDGRVDDFYGRICEATTRMTSMRRAVIFRYDRARRQVRPAGGYGLELGLFEDGFFTVEIAPIARRALEQDNVLEASEHLERELPLEYVKALGVTQIVCTPMVARGRWLGVILADRAGVGAPLEDTERETLWVLGKTAALAATARIATRQHERALQLEQRIEMARSIHDGVIQRLFGLSLALDGEQPLDEEIRARTVTELQTALADLRRALVRPLGQALPPTTVTLRDELQRLASCHPRLGLSFDPSAIRVPRQLEPLAQAVLIEGVRNAQRHATPTYLQVTTALDAGTFKLELVNDGARDTSAAGTGMGLRVAAFAALQTGGLLEFGRLPEDRWRVQLIAPEKPR
jgi:signal transduction histidine kinase